MFSATKSGAGATAPNHRNRAALTIIIIIAFKFFVLVTEKGLKLLLFLWKSTWFMHLTLKCTKY